MARSRKRAEEGAMQSDHHETPEGPVTTATAERTSNDVEQAFQEQSADAQRTESNEGKFKPIRDTFTSSAAGIKAGEDKRFQRPQVFIDFADDKRATDEEKAELKDAGLRYRPTDKGYSALANNETRAARDQLAQKFTERRLKGDEGMER